MSDVYELLRDAWNSQRGASKLQAMRAYAEVAHGLGFKGPPAAPAQDLAPATIREAESRSSLESALEDEWDRGLRRLVRRLEKAGPPAASRPQTLVGPAGRSEETRTVDVALASVPQGGPRLPLYHPASVAAAVEAVGMVVAAEKGAGGPGRRGSGARRAVATLLAEAAAASDGRLRGTEDEVNLELLCK